MGYDGSKFGVHILDEFLVEDDAVVDAVCCQDEVACTWTVFGRDGGRVTKKCEKEEIDDVICFISF